jgi:hypothetical protein
VTGLLHHFDQHLSGFRRGGRWARECHAGALDAVCSFHAYVKTEAIDRSHRRFLGFDPGKLPHQ